MPDLGMCCARCQSAPCFAARGFEPDMSWSLFGRDGRLNWGLVTFVVLAAACVAVWGTLLVQFISYRRCGRAAELLHSVGHSAPGMGVLACLQFPLGPGGASPAAAGMAMAACRMCGCAPAGSLRPCTSSLYHSAAIWLTAKAARAHCACMWQACPMSTAQLHPAVLLAVSSGFAARRPRARRRPLVCPSQPRSTPVPAMQRVRRPRSARRLHHLW